MNVFVAGGSGPSAFPSCAHSSRRGIRSRLESIFVFSMENDAISAIRVVRNPDKLAHIDRQLKTLH